MTVEFGSLIAIGIFIITNLVVTVWWMAKTSTLMDVIQNDLKEVMVEFKLSRGVYSTKEEVSSALAIVQKEITAIWKVVDKLNERRP